MPEHGRIAVAGATGRVGRHVVDLLEAGGHEVVQISRSNGVDLVGGDGLADALTGVTTVVDVATHDSPDEEAATAFFTAAARNLEEAGGRAGVERIVLLSIIGIDRFSTGYYAAKRRQEQALLSGPIPVRILRASQFHEYIPEMIGWFRQDDAAYVPSWPTQPIAARQVAEALVEVATGTGPARSSSRPGSATRSESRSRATCPSRKARSTRRARSFPAPKRPLPARPSSSGWSPRTAPGRTPRPDSDGYSSSGSGRRSTAEEWMIEVVVRPNGVKRSRISSRSSIVFRWSFRKKQSSPVIRWHSTTSGVSRASSRIRSSCLVAGATRTTAAMA